MTKYYCDRCGKESKLLHDIKIPNTKNSIGFETKTIAVCISCEEEANRLYDKLTDIRFVLFNDFMKGGAE